MSKNKNKIIEALKLKSLQVKYNHVIETIEKGDYDIYL